MSAGTGAILGIRAMLQQMHFGMPMPEQQIRQLLATVSAKTYDANTMLHLINYSLS